MDAWDYTLIHECTGSFSCAICDCFMDGSKSADEHVNGRRHLRAIYRYGSFITPQGNGEFYCNLCNCWVFSTHNILGHMKGQRHQESLADLRTQRKDSDPYHVIIVEEDEKNYCYLCDSSLIGDAQVYSHIDSEEHKNAVEKYDYDIVPSTYKWFECTLCDCTISSYKDVYEHISGPEHAEELENQSSLE